MRSHTARHYTGLAIVALLAAACEQPVPVAGLESGLSRIVVSPKVAALRTTQIVDLMVVGLSGGGDTVPTTVTWSVSSGSLTDTSTTGGRHYGRYKAAATPGTFKVIATGNPGGKSDTATVTVSPVPVQSVTVAPAGPSLASGTTLQLSATTLDSAGNTLPGRPVTWATSNSAVATVNGSGLVAGVAAGSATVTATSEGKSGTSAVTVTAPVANPGTVNDLAVASVTDNSVTLSLTEVTDGSGQAASYEVRWAAGALSWGSAAQVSLGTCKVPLLGTTIGAKRNCTVQGLAASTGYQFQIIAFRGTLNVNAVFGNLSNVAGGTTATSTAPVASVTLSPGTASVVPTGTQQLAVTLKDAAGNTLTGRSVTWTSSAPLVASVNGSGLVSGLAVGAATITATSEGQSGTAAITVTALPPPPPAGWPNQPTGMTVRTDWGMDVAVPSGYPLDVPIPGAAGWHVVYEQSPGTAHGFAQLGVDAGAPFSPAGVYDFVYPQGMVEGNAPATVYYPGLGASEVYAGFWWKPSAPFDAGPNGNKIAFIFNGGGGAGGQQFIILKGDGLLHVLPEYPGDYRWRDPNVNATPVTLGAWHRVEWYSNVATGTMKYWLDGVLQGSYTDVRNSYSFDMFEFSPTWGGNSGAQKRETDHYWFDHVHLSVR